MARHLLLLLLLWGLLLLEQLKWLVQLLVGQVGQVAHWRQHEDGRLGGRVVVHRHGLLLVHDSLVLMLVLVLYKHKLWLLVH